jgi:hypothetical protein
MKVKSKMPLNEDEITMMNQRIKPAATFVIGKNSIHNESREFKIT